MIFDVHFGCRWRWMYIWCIFWWAFWYIFDVNVYIFVQFWCTCIFDVLLDGHFDVYLPFVEVSSWKVWRWMYVYLYSFGAHVYLMYFLMDILLYIRLLGRYFLDPFNGYSFLWLAFCLNKVFVHYEEVAFGGV
jgi:hypothetical protein